MWKNVPNGSVYTSRCRGDAVGQLVVQQKETRDLLERAPLGELDEARKHDSAVVCVMVMVMVMVMVVVMVALQGRGQEQRVRAAVGGIGGQQQQRRA